MYLYDPSNHLDRNASMSKYCVWHASMTTDELGSIVYGMQV
jgi:hypothetical protein